MKVLTGDQFRGLMEQCLETRMPDDAKYILFAVGDSWVLGSVARYNGYDCEISVCSGGDNPPMFGAIRKFMYYVFEELGCVRATSLVYEELEHAQRLNQICGFKQEGVLREAGLEGQDVLIMGLLKRELNPRLIWKPDRRLREAA